MYPINYIISDHAKTERLLDSLKEYGKDWEAVAEQTNEDPEVCQQSFSLLEKKMKKADGVFKKNVMGTGTYIKLFTGSISKQGMGPCYITSYWL